MLLYVCILELPILLFIITFVVYYIIVCRFRALSGPSYEIKIYCITVICVCFNGYCRAMFIHNYILKTVQYISIIINHSSFAIRPNIIINIVNLI